jgi:hypothetical protein
LYDFRIKKSFGVGFDEADQRLNQILGLPAGGADKNPVSAMNMAENLLLGSEFLGVDLLHFFTNFLGISQIHLQPSI